MGDNSFIKILYLILNNKDLIIADQSLFSRETLMIVRAIISGKLANNFELTSDQRKLIIEAFIELKNTFNRHTPDFIIENNDCIKIAVSQDINSVNYLSDRDLNMDLINHIVSEALKQNYILTTVSPNFLASNFQVAINSLKLKIKSADYINWDTMNKDEIEQLTDELIKGNYFFTATSHPFLKSNVKVAYDAIKKNNNNVKYISDDLKRHPLIFKYLMMHGYEYTESQIAECHLNCFTDEEIIGETFKRLDLYKNDNSKYVERFTKLYNDAINHQPLIKDFDDIFMHIASEMWKEYRRECNGYYDNVFGKICAELRTADTFKLAINNLDFLEQMHKILENKYLELFCAMDEYYNLFHSNISNKLAALGPAKDKIAELSALYISKSKDIYFDEQVQAGYSYLYNYYTLKLDHPYVYRRLTFSRQREQFKQRYQNQDPEICAFISELVKMYAKEENSEFIRSLIDKFIVYDANKLNMIIRSPYGYKDYLRYEKAIKLIRRLNSGYITYNGVEVFNYHDIISFDEQTKTYIYTGKQFDEEELLLIDDYRRKKQLIEKIKKAIMLKVKSLTPCDEIDDNLVSEIAEEVPFTDEYFIFEKDLVTRSIKLDSLIKVAINKEGCFNLKSFTDDRAYQYVYNLLVNQGMIWLLIAFNEFEPDFDFFGININSIIDLINNMPKIIKLANAFKFDINNFKELLLVYEISVCTNEETVAILGKEIIEKLSKNKEYTNNNIEDILNMAKELVCQMTKRSQATVPYINGTFLNYCYSMYDQQDVSILTSGIDTDACFRIDGNDNDFLHYCALDKNGFVLKITDEFGQLIARASGFRHGNCVFINQLRTIYDASGEGYLGEYENETADIIKTFQKACQEILMISHNNPEEIRKIDFVFVNKSYSLENYSENIADDVAYEIGFSPMDTESDDWEKFVSNTKNLQEAWDVNSFTTDYGGYPIICMAAIKPCQEININDIKLCDVPAVYERDRSKILVGKINDEIIFKNMNRIKAINCYLNNHEFEIADFPQDAIIVTGDNWYAVYCGNYMIESCLIDDDDNAIREFGIIQQIIKQVFDQNLTLEPTEVINYLQRIKKKI